MNISLKFFIFKPKEKFTQNTFNVTSKIFSVEKKLGV